jgi:hypothetical protein
MNRQDAKMPRVKTHTLRSFAEPLRSSAFNQIFRMLSIFISFAIILIKLIAEGEILMCDTDFFYSE